MAPVRTTGAIVAAVSVAVLSVFFCNLKSKSSSSKNPKLSKSSNKKPKHGLVGAVGDTPLIRINSLSDATGCEIRGKCEFLNPGGSVKDRVAVKIIEEEFFAMNCVGAVRVARAIGPGHTIVTILCDSGMRHLSKFYSDEYLSQFGLTPKATGLEFLSIK